MNKKIDEYIKTAMLWPAELKRLREILLDCGLKEEFKWRQPCYSSGGNNIAIIGELKRYCTLGFFKGALLSDPNGLLVQQTKNTQSARMIPFVSVREIDEMEETIKALVAEAIEVEKSGMKVDFVLNREYEIPEELQSAFDFDPSFHDAFHALTLGRQRGYVLYFSGAKQSATRTSRIEKYRDKIFDGLGMND